MESRFLYIRFISSQAAGILRQGRQLLWVQYHRAAFFKEPLKYLHQQ